MTSLASDLRFGGDLRLRVIRNPRGRVLDRDEILFHASPQPGLAEEINDWRSQNRPRIVEGLEDRLRVSRLASGLSVPVLLSQLWLTRIRADGVVSDFGLASLRLVTTAGVNFLVDAFQGIAEPELMRFHGIGTNNTAEGAGDTALGAELTTAYNPDNTRASGTQVEGSGANVYQTVATNTVDAPVTITEHGIFSQASTAGGILWDRSVFTGISLGNGDGLQSTYDLTITAGG